jgi:hypothetical protein
VCALFVFVVIALLLSLEGGSGGSYQQTCTGKAFLRLNQHEIAGAGANSSS